MASTITGCSRDRAAAHERSEPRRRMGGMPLAWQERRDRRPTPDRAGHERINRDSSGFAPAAVHE
jgi:hypothetical protein